MGDVYKKIDTYIKDNKVKGIIPLLYNCQVLNFIYLSSCLKRLKVQTLFLHR